MNFAQATQQENFILSYKDLNDKTGFIKAQIKTIFYLTSQKKDFDSDIEKQEFAEKWLMPYLDQFPEYTLVSIDKNNVVSGYLTGCPDTSNAMNTLNFNYMTLFQHLYQNYPAHFHINVHPNYQGKGIGKQLVHHFEDCLKPLNIKGTHIVTHPKALNINFYKKTGYVNTESQTENYFFMGKKL
ncbi:MAG: GNAT family N-acetyltransferase [Bdellovibrionales bacterium]|nr:GNAT family N-acetyltransferase [Bdellovibrionales bacterium]